MAFYSNKISPQRLGEGEDHAVNGHEQNPDEQNLSSGNNLNLHSNPAHSNTLIEDDEEY